MRKVLLALAITTVSSAAFAQGNINKGDWMVGGSASFTSSKVKGSSGSSTDFSLSPDAGYFFADQFAGGLSFAFASSKEAGASESASTVLAAPFVRYYFLPSSQKVNVFANATYGFGSMKFGGESAGLNAWSISAGPSIFLTPAAALEFAVHYTSTGGKAYNDNRLNAFGLQVGFQIHLPGSGASK